MNHDPIEDLLRSTASETRTAIADADFGHVPPFEPNPNRTPVVVASIALLLAVGIGGWFVRASAGDEASLETANDPTQQEGQVPETDRTLAPDSSSTSSAPQNAPVVELDVREQVELEQPAFGETYMDPAFGSSITRVTNASAGEKILPIQSPAAVWNADESKLLLYQTGIGVSGHVIIDAETLEVTGRLAISPTDIEHVFWHPVDADLIVATTEGEVAPELVTVSVSTGAVTTIASYPECDSLTPGGGSAGPSWDGEIMALLCEAGEVDSVLSQPLNGDPAARREVPEGQDGMASPDGESIIISTDTGFEVYDAGLTELRTTIAWEASGPTVGVDGEGNSVIVSAGFESDYNAILATAQLDGGSNGEEQVEVIVGGATGYPGPRSGTKVSATAWNVDGLMAAASPLPVDVQEGGPIELFDGEVTLADLSTSPATVTRLAHTRNHGGDYFSSAVVSISPSGRYIAFASDWGGDSTDTYVIDRNA